MNNSGDNNKQKDGKDKKMSPQEIVEGFRRLREEQRQIANKITEFEMEKSEHKLVIESLEGLDGDRKCFRLITGILVERTVKEVLPALQKNLDQVEFYSETLTSACGYTIELSKLMDTLNEQLVVKGKEVNEYRDKYNIRIQGEDLPGVAKRPTGATATIANAEGDSAEHPLNS